MQHLRFALNLGVSCRDDVCAHVRWESEKAHWNCFVQFSLRRAVATSLPWIALCNLPSKAHSHFFSYGYIRLLCSPSHFFLQTILFHQAQVCVFSNVSLIFVIRVFYSNFLFHFQFCSIFFVNSSLTLSFWFAFAGAYNFSLIFLPLVVIMPLLFEVYTVEYLLLALPHVFNAVLLLLLLLCPFFKCVHARILYFTMSFRVFFFFLLSSVTWNSHSDNFRCDARQQLQCAVATTIATKKRAF